MEFPATLDVEALLAPHRAKYGDGNVAAVMTVSGPFVFRGPDEIELARFEDAAKKSGRIAACKILCIITVVSCDRVVMGETIAKKPGIATTCADEILSLAGVDANAEVKK